MGNDAGPMLGLIKEKNMKLLERVFPFAGTAIIFGVLFAQPMPAAAQQKLVFGVDGSYAPFATINKKGQLQGFEVDLANAICAELKAKCEFRNIPYDGIFAALEANKIDVVAAGLNITDERKKKYLMTGPFLKSPLSFMVTNGSTIDGTVATLNGKTVSTVGGSTFERYLREKWRSVNVQTYDSMDAAVLDLDAGRVVAVLGEQAQLAPAYIQAKPGAYKFAGTPVVDPAFMGQGKGMALRKNDTELLNKLNQAISKVNASGKRSELSLKWFGILLPAN